MYQINKSGITYMHTATVVVQNKDNILKILQWLKQYCVGQYTWKQGHKTNERVVSFQHESDLVNFTLYWV
jgi:hypothetical protein